MKNLILIGILIIGTMSFATEKKGANNQPNTDLIGTWDLSTSFVHDAKNCCSVLESYNFYSDNSCEIVKTVKDINNVVTNVEREYLDWKKIGNNIIFFNSNGKQTKVICSKKDIEKLLVGVKTSNRIKQTDAKQYHKLLMSDEIVYVQ